MDIIMTDIELITPIDVMQKTAQRAKALRLAQNITQLELADRVGIAIGTVKRFEKSGLPRLISLTQQKKLTVLMFYSTI